MGILSKFSIAAAPFDFEGKKLFRSLVEVATIAAAGSVSTDATALTAGKNLVTAADGTKGVILPRSEPEMAITVVNTVAGEDLKVYPDASGQINALTATTGAFTVPGGQEATFHCDAGLHWYVRAGTVSNTYDTTTGITAFATGGQTSATALTSEWNNVTTVATAGDSVKLPAAAAGKKVTIKNSGATSLAVFPATGDSVNALAVNLSVNIPVGGELTFRAISDTVWETNEALVLPAPTTQTGELVIKAANNAADHEVILTNASHGQATTHTIPDGGAATDYGVYSTAALTLAEADVLDGVTPGTSAPSKVLTTDAAESLVWATTDATASETVTLSIQDTRTGPGATGWAHKSELVSNVALGAYANGLYGLMTFGSAGSVTGLAAGVVGEVELSAGTTSGTYAALEAELVANAAVSTGTDTGFIYGNIAGSNATGKTTINTNAHLMVLGTGVVDTTSGLWDAIGAQAVTASGRLRIKIGATLYYIPVCASAALTS